MANLIPEPSLKKNVQADFDPTAASRKHDHIDLAFRSYLENGELDQRFYYEPLLSAHPRPGSLASVKFIGQELSAPIWVSSMTGGTELALKINRNLAQACAEFGLGMGLGSCRSLLYGNERFEDFNIRPYIGKEQPLYGNLGLAQLEKLIADQELYRIDRLVELLDLNGLIIHVNPFQEWLQPEGDRFSEPPLKTIETLLAHYPNLPIIVKEVGQGMGPASLRALLALPLAAVDTAASGGTNFSKLELLRSDAASLDAYMPIARQGHMAEEMTDFINEIVADPTAEINCRQLIISGGVRNFLDGYYLTERVQLPAIYGMASGFLKHAMGDYAALATFVRGQIRGLELSNAFLRIK